MKRTKFFWALLIFVFGLVSVLLSGCSEEEPSWHAFDGAINEKGFPVPQDANTPDRTTANAAMDYVRYSLPGLKAKEGIPDPYMDAIEAWGWEEIKAEEVDGSSRIFKKDQSIVHITVYDDYFILMVPKEKKAAL